MDFFSLFLHQKEKGSIKSLLMRTHYKLFFFFLFFLSFSFSPNPFVDSKGLSCNHSSSSGLKPQRFAFLHFFESRIFPVNNNNNKYLSERFSIQQGIKTFSKKENKILFAGSQAASRVPVSNKQLKQREQAKVQLVGEVLTHVKSSEEKKESEEERRKRTKEWRVVLHNDDVHTFECVEVAITKVLPQVSRARAYDIALHAHTNGKATIMLTWEEKAREVALALQNEGLTISILPDRIFTANI